MTPKIPWYKYTLSYILDIHLECIRSPFEYDLTICLSKGKIQLIADNAVYSWEEKYENFYEAFRQINWQQEQIESTLILGMGLGSIPQMLESSFNYKGTYTCVEIDEEVVYLAHKYTMHKLKNPAEILVTDAFVFVQTTERTFDLICLDIFVGETIPQQFLTAPFLQTLKERLNTNGILMINMLTNSMQNRSRSKQYYDDIFSKTFETSTAFHVKGNHILVNRAWTV